MTRQRDYRGKVYAPGRGVVQIHSIRKQYPAWLTDLVSEQTKILEHETVPATADYLVTRARLSADIERSAARFGAMPVVLPAAAEWLRTKVAYLTESVGIDVVIVLYNPELLLPRKVAPQ